MSLTYLLERIRSVQDHKLRDILERLLIRIEELEEQLEEDRP